MQDTTKPENNQLPEPTQTPTSDIHTTMDFINGVAPESAGVWEKFVRHSKQSSPKKSK